MDTMKPYVLTLARAIENQCYVLAAAQYGIHNEKRKSYGHAIAVSPWGEVLADAGGYDSVCVEESSSEENSLVPKIVLCEIDSDAITLSRERIPVRNHRESCPFSWS
jgi:predicted amidohydrolase